MLQCSIVSLQNFPVKSRKKREMERDKPKRGDCGKKARSTT